MGLYATGMSLLPKLGIAVALVLATAGCGQPGTQAANQQASERAEPQAAEAEPGKGVDRSSAGKPAPAVELLNPEGKQGPLPSPGGKPMLVNLWASWCAPCVKELPTLQALSMRPGAPRIVEVSEDSGPRTSIDAFLAGHGIDKLKSWQDPKMSLTGTLGAEVLPTTIYYDGDGREVWRFVGDLDWTGPEAAKLLQEKLSPATAR